jgi:flagellar biosynthetic protein FliP
MIIPLGFVQNPDVMKLSAEELLRGGSLQVLVFLTALTLLPALVACLTPFLRISIVLHFLRQAIGAQNVPSNPVLIGLSLLLAFGAMRPVLSASYEAGWVAFQEGRLDARAAWQAGEKPIRRFMLHFAREQDIALMVEIAGTPSPKSASEVGIEVLAPAYMLSELRTAFRIGAVLFLPFLVIDLVVASITLSVGMVQLPPVMLSAPLKIMLFVLADGWNLVIGSLVRSVKVAL